MNLFKKVINIFSKKEVANTPVEETGELRVSNNAIKNYLSVCPTSSRKSQYDERIIAYKIRRAAELGRLMTSRSNGTIVIGYYNINVIIHKDEVAGVVRKKHGSNKRLDKYVFVSEKVKKRYDRENKPKFKVAV
jgi:hypothetical protein